MFPLERVDNARTQLQLLQMLLAMIKSHARIKSPKEPSPDLIMLNISIWEIRSVVSKSKSMFHSAHQQKCNMVIHADTLLSFVIW